MYGLPCRRIGRFTISGLAIDLAFKNSQQEVFKLIFQQLFPLYVQHDVMTDTYDVKCISYEDQFDIVQLGHPIPEYKVTVSNTDHSLPGGPVVTFQRMP